ncbi:unnamed protein product [Medioppia subpectinata]|uniref:Uncharacterized protein n=1 Tax=Medioppia subpectinata TaxID=1979941 RepID=A0A7R9PUR7_9ACAR|nr:unnamed protein product [Medioppia subpectinata]CAG2101059.1 unnamed protein product [Medioppia subpectinata]
MSGPNVVDKAKMVFHYVAKIANRPTTGAEAHDSNREMKASVCFRHSKHSIKCDANAPCLECDSGLKLYSYEQCRRHLDVVRSEKRFESIEVDRSENMIEKLSDIDGERAASLPTTTISCVADNGRKVTQLLDAIVAKEAEILRALSDRAVVEEAVNCSLKEISRNGLKSQKRVDELCERLNACQLVLEGMAANGAQTATNHSAQSERLAEMNTTLDAIRGHVSDEMTSSRDWRSQCLTAIGGTRERMDALIGETRETRECVARIEAALEKHVEALRAESRAELERGRSQLEDCVGAVKTQVLTALSGIREEMQSLGNSSHVLATDLKDSLPEKLMDVFGGILMLSSDSSRRLDDTSEHVINSL